MRVGIAANHLSSDAGDQRVGAGSEPALDAVAEPVADGAERSRIETMGELKQALRTPET